jgi:hypothetical protein
MIDEKSGICPSCGITFPATDKERFDLGISMMKAYYDALESRLASTVAVYMVVIGWLISSDDARQTLASHPRLLLLSVGVLTLVLFMYGWNVWHWLARWLQIRETTERLNYMQTHFYTRYYKIPRGTWLFYFTPIFLMYLFALGFLWALSAGFFLPKLLCK